MKTEEEIIEGVKEIISNNANLPIKFKTLSGKLDLDKNEEKILSQVIDDLADSGELLKVRENKFSTPEKEGLIVGTFQANEKGFGFVLPDGEDEDIFIGPRNINGAFNKDIVLCEVTKEKGTKSREGRIVKILERGTDTYVGEYQDNKTYGFVKPDSRRMTKDIFIPSKLNKGAVTGEKVLVKITKYVDDKNPEGEIIEVLGHKDDPGVDILSIIKEYDVPTEFGEDVRLELESIPNEIDSNDIEGRKDIRDWMIVTIDGEDTKDIDDAISIDLLPNGNYRLGVHIADVTNYVKEDSALDKEAFKRGNSIYVVDRVIPMLPHKLSNGICSLNEGVDRYALSCIMEFDRSGDRVNYEITKSVINSNKRMTYTEVQGVIDNDPKYLEEDKDFIDMIGRMKDLENILFQKRIKRGALEFITEECKIYLDENGKACEIKKYERSLATQIIEEFMLAANETVAEEYSFNELPFVFRSHEEPDSEKLEYVAALVRSIGIPFRLNEEKIYPKEIQKVLEQIEGKKEEGMLSKLMLRSMKQAKYTPTNDGHFGLAAKYYCHFTSPIRRYADLTIHRIIKENIEQGIIDDRLKHYKHRTAEVATRTSKCERVADEIEREVEEYKKCEYMQNYLEEEFDGVVSGVTGFGIFVELDNTVEGLVRLADLGDNYEYDEKRYCLIGQNTGRIFTLGDKVRIKVAKVNLEAREIDFEFIKAYNEKESINE
ncbi:MAG: ribonuclease R [Clostridia bacterium]|nr:ribonuclease R [Clostridia bacterium]